jgi:hypothetical protein
VDEGLVSLFGKEVSVKKGYPPGDEITLLTLLLCNYLFVETGA